MSRYHDAIRTAYGEAPEEGGGVKREREIAELQQQFDAPPAAAPANRSLYQQLLAAEVPMDSHESDLYAEVTPESTRIIEEADLQSAPTTFRSRTDGRLWYDIPFAYDPFWPKTVTQQTPTVRQTR